MGQYQLGDVVLAPVSLGNRHVKKARPVVIVADSGDGIYFVCPVSSTPSYDTSCIPLDLRDFTEGGLDLFQESYVLTGNLCTMHSSEVIGKKGRLTGESVATILSLAGLE
ncbi:MAG TPA: type II toxin-antitoxin system PemK/MazF family toxin [Methanoregulaceae archaeon]|nr:type II toxin-antitoxin system PemK/MazF family toxin [Methanoregulaceae archaeon]